MFMPIINPGVATEPDTDIRAGISTLTRTTDGLQTFSPAILSGYTPTGLIYVGSLCAVDSTAIDASASYGVYDGTNQLAQTASSEDNLSTTNTGKRISNAMVGNPCRDDSRGSEHTSHIVEDAGGAAGFQSGGVELNYNWVRDDGGNALMQFGGTNIKCAAGTINPSGTAGGTATVSGLTFQPIAIIFISNEMTTTGYAASVTARWSYGFCDSALNQASINMQADDGAGATAKSMRVSNSYVYQRPGSTGEALEVTAINSDGFTVTSRTGNPLDCYYIAIGGDSSDLQSKVVSDQPSGASGSVSGAGFWPKAGVHLWSDVASLGTRITNSDADWFSVGMSAKDGSDGIDQACVAHKDEDSADPSIADSWIDTDRVARATYGFSVDSYNSDGFDWSAVGGNPDGNHYAFHLLLG